MGVGGLRAIAHGVLLLQSPFKTHEQAPPERCVVDCKFDCGEGSAPTKKALMQTSSDRIN